MFKQSFMQIAEQAHPREDVVHSVGIIQVMKV